MVGDQEDGHVEHNMVLNTSAAPEEETFILVSDEYVHASAKCLELADLVGANICHVKEPGRNKKYLGFRCHRRLYEMATLDDHATLADKICLASDLKDRRDHTYARALLRHIFPKMPNHHQSAVVQSFGILRWLKSDPRGQWCSQNDKAFMYMTVKNYICNNREEIASSLWQKQGNNGAAAMTPSERTLSDDQVQHVIDSWRGPHLETLGVPWESTTSGHIGSPSNIPRPRPLDNSISLPVFRTGWGDDPICPEPLDLAKAGNLRAQRQYERFLGGSHSENHQGEKCQANFEDFGGAQESMSKSEARELEKALSGMHLGTPSREISKQQTCVDSSRSHDTHIAVRRQQVREMKRRLVAEALANASAKALMYACRKQSTDQKPLGGRRRSKRLASQASKTPSDNPSRKDTGRVGKANSKNTRHAAKLRRDQQCDEDVSRFRLNPSIDLSRKRLRQVRQRLGPAVMSEMDEIRRREQRQKMTSAAPLTSLGTVEDDSAKAHGENSWRHETGLLGHANEEATPGDSHMEFDSIVSRMERMDTS